MAPPLVQRHIYASLSKILARSFLSYGSEAWTLQNGGERITASKMNFMQNTLGYTKWDHRKN